MINDDGLDAIRASLSLFYFHSGRRFLTRKLTSLSRSICI
jgi:hypothetical protein